MADEVPGDPWLNSQLLATKVYHDLHGRFTTEELVAFSVHYLTQMAVGPYSSVEMFVEYVKRLAGWYNLILEGNMVTHDGIQQRSRPVSSDEAPPPEDVGDSPDDPMGNTQS